MVVHNVIMEEDDDLEALRLAALQTIRPRKPTVKRNMVSINTHRHLEKKGPFIQSEVNPNLIAIVPSVLPPPKIDSSKLPMDSNDKPPEKVSKLSQNNSLEQKTIIEKLEKKNELKKSEKDEPQHRISDNNKKFTKIEKSDLFDLEEDVLDFETESLGGSEEDTLQLHDSDSDSLEQLMEQIEEELSSPIKTMRLKQKNVSLLVNASGNSNNKISEIKNKVITSKPGSPKISSNAEDRISPTRRRYSPPKKKNSMSSHPSPRRSRSPITQKRSNTPRKRSLTPRKRSITPRKRSLSPRKRSITPHKRSLTPRKRSISPRRRSGSPHRRSLTPHRRSQTPRMRSITPRRRSITPHKRSISPRRRSPWRFSPRRRSISPHHRRSISPRRRSPIDWRRSPSMRRRSLSPRRPQLSPRRRSSSPNNHSLSPRRRSLTPRKRSLTPRKRSLSPRKRSLSPRKRSLSPRKRSLSPRKRSLSPRKRSLSPRKRSSTPRKRSVSPRKRSLSPWKRSLSPHRRSISPKQNIQLKRQRVRSPVNTKRVKRLSPSGTRRGWMRNKASSVSNRQNNSKQNLISNNKNLKEEDKKRRGDLRENKPKEKDVNQVPIKNDNEPENGEIKPLDPKLEARRRKFETNFIVEPLNKKIRLKSEFGKGEINEGSKSDENQIMGVKRKRIVLSNEGGGEEKVTETKAKPLLPKVSNKLKKIDEQKIEEEEVVIVKKKRKEIIQELTKEEGKKGVDLRAELSRRRAERLKGASIDPMARIVQSAIEGAVGKIKIKSRTSPGLETEAPVTEKKSKPKGRRVHVLPAKPSKSEDKKKSSEEKNVGISMNYRSISPVRVSGRSILRRNQV